MDIIQLIVQDRRLASYLLHSAVLFVEGVLDLRHHAFLLWLVMSSSRFDVVFSFVSSTAYTVSAGRGGGGAIVCGGRRVGNAHGRSSESSSRNCVEVILRIFCRLNRRIVSDYSVVGMFGRRRRVAVAQLVAQVSSIRGSV